MKAKIPGLVVALVVVIGVGTTGVAAQEVATEIQFEDEVVQGEATTITYVATVEETPMETDVEVELTLLVDGEEVQSVTSEEEVFEGAELRTEFDHTFDSPGEKEVTVDSVTEALGQEITDSTTATVTVAAADEDDGNSTDEDLNGTDGGMEDGMDDGDDTDDGMSEDGTDDGDDTDNSNTGDEPEDGGDGSGDGTDGDTQGDTDDSDEGDGAEGESEGLPGFGVAVALVSLVVVAVYTSRKERS